MSRVWLAQRLGVVGQDVGHRLDLGVVLERQRLQPIPNLGLQLDHVAPRHIPTIYQPRYVVHSLDRLDLTCPRRAPDVPGATVTRERPRSRTKDLPDSKE